MSQPKHNSSCLTDLSWQPMQCLEWGIKFPRGLGVEQLCPGPQVCPMPRPKVQLSIRRGYGTTLGALSRPSAVLNNILGIGHGG